MRFWGLLLLPYFLYAAYVDNDLDGVDDSVDLCPNTPFEILVDEKGCNIAKKRSFVNGSWTLQAGVSRNIDTLYDDTSLLNLYLDYKTGSWDIAISSNNTNTGRSGIVDLEDDLFVTVGYSFRYDKIDLRLFGGTKFAFMQEERNSRDNDYYGGFNVDYTVNNTYDIFAYYSYTLSSDSPNIDYTNFHSLSLGAGHYIRDNLYGALSYNYIGSYYEGGKDYRSLSLYAIYLFGERTFFSFNYAYGLNASSYDHSILLNFGVRFE